MYLELLIEPIDDRDGVFLKGAQTMGIFAKLTSMLGKRAQEDVKVYKKTLPEAWSAEKPSPVKDSVVPSAGPYRLPVVYNLALPCSFLS